MSRLPRWKPLASMVTFAVVSSLAAGCSSAQSSESSPPARAESSDAADETALQGLTECGSLWQSGDAAVTPSPFSEFAQIRADIVRLVEELPADTIVSYGSGQSVYGRLSVGLSTRDVDVLQRIRAIDERYGEQDDICVDVPPSDYYDQPLRAATWSAAEMSLPVSEHWQAMTLSVGGECGGNSRPYIRPPEVVYTNTEVQISVRLDHAPWGSAEDTVCQAPATVLVELTEDPGNRVLVDPLAVAESTVEGGAVPNPTPPPSPTPAPPTPPGDGLNPTATVLLQRFLLDAGFEHIVGDAPHGPAWSADATWGDDRFEIALFQDQVPTRLGESSELIDCPGVGILHVASDMPEPAQLALRTAVGCDMSPRQDFALTVEYETCVRTAGIVPFEAQVFVDTSATPVFVKTAPEVPTQIHSPCWQGIGGAPTTLSSFGFSATAVAEPTPD